MTTLDHLQMNFEFIEARLSQVEQDLADLKKQQKKKKKQEVNSQMVLESAKQLFIESNPKERSDSFTDDELVFWAGYVMGKRGERVTTFKELNGRKKHIIKLLAHFMVLGNTESAARNLAKDYLEYVLSFPTYKTSEGMQPMNFYVATSDWAVNHYSKELDFWRKTKNLPADKSLD